MSKTQHTDGRKRLRDRLPNGINPVGLTVLLLVTALAFTGGFAVGQEATVWEEDFEDGSMDGWVTDNPTASVVLDGFDGDRSLRVSTDEADGSVVWGEGPVLDMEESFEIEGLMRGQRTSGTDSTAHIRVGIEDDLEDPDVNALLMFNEPQGVTFLSSDALVDASELDANDDNVMAGSFNDEWVRYRIWSDSDDNTLYAKVWPAGDEEPVEAQLEESFEGVNGEFSVVVGEQESDERVLWLDSVRIDGEEAIDPNLELITQSWLPYGGTADYRVAYTNPDTGDREDVTENATVTSPRPEIVFVDSALQQIQATDDDGVNERVRLKAEYEEADAPSYKYVTVASPSLDNMEILPTMQRIQATMTDPNIRVIIVAIFGGIIGTRFSSAFGGLGFSTLVMVVGWFGGWVETGIVMVALFTALFIGLNLAANIDYTVRR